jgi:hypothetical protein
MKWEIPGVSPLKLILVFPNQFDSLHFDYRHVSNNLAPKTHIEYGVPVLSNNTWACDFNI